MSQRRTYTINEVATLTGLHRNTIRQRVKQGLLEASVEQGKFGEEYRISLEALASAGLPLRNPPPDLDLRAENASSPSAPVFDAEFAEHGPSDPGADGRHPEIPAAAIAALGDLYQRHEQAMFRLGYLQGELERLKALADTAESLREDSMSRDAELRNLKAALEEKERRAAEAAALRQELERAREHLREMETLRRDLEHLKTLADQQERMIGVLERKRPWWQFWKG